MQRIPITHEIIQLQKRPGGEPVRVGGWPALFNPGGNAMTLNGTVHLNDLEDYEQYVNDDRWSRHERRHIEQEIKLGGDPYNFARNVAFSYILAGSHDGSPFEIDAENAANDENRRKFTHGLYPFLNRLFAWE